MAAVRRSSDDSGNCLCSKVNAWKDQSEMNLPVVLVSAPFLSVVRPALGISNLKSALESAGVPTAVEYLNIRYAETIGVDLHEHLAEKSPFPLLVGEWLFSKAINGTSEPHLQETYLEELSRHYSPAVLEKLHSVRECAGCFVDREAQRLVALNPSIIGFSSLFQQNCASLSLAARIKELKPEIIVCFGGANCEGPMGRALLDTYPQIDYVFSGESEHTFTEFVRRCLNETTPYTTSSSVYCRREVGRHGVSQPVLINGRTDAPAPLEMDRLPVPDFSDYFEALASTGFSHRVVPALLFETSRGCWWGAKKHCTFCGLNGSNMTYRAKSADRVLKEIEELHGRWSVPRFEAVDNIMDMKNIETVFDVLGRQGTEYRFAYEIKSNLTWEQLRRLALGGVTWIQPGIESLDDEVLQLMEKGVTALQNIRLLRNCVELGLQPVWNLLYGFPGERPDQYQRMSEFVPMLEHLAPPVGCASIHLDRFSPYFERAAELGFTEVRPAPVYEAVYGLPADVLSRLAYFFEGRAASLAQEDYAKPLRRAVHQWRDAVSRAAEEPVLSIVTMGEISAVRDTRSCTADTWRFLNEREAQVLRAFRDPQNIRAALNRLKADGAEASDSTEIFERLVDWKYILVDKDRALSLVVEAGRRVHPADIKEQFPGGWLIDFDEQLSFLN